MNAIIFHSFGYVYPFRRFYFLGKINYINSFCILNSVGAEWHHEPNTLVSRVKRKGMKTNDKY